jgi:hypothetical protein
MPNPLRALKPKKHGLVNQKAELKGKLETFEQNRENRFELPSGGEIVGGGVQKTVESIGRIQFRTRDKARRLRRNFV